MDSCTLIDVCRICGGRDIAVVLDLGEQPLANSLPRPDAARDVARYPLTLMRCDGCGLLQLRESIAPELLFSEYLYFSSYSKALVDSARELTSRMVESRRPGPNDLVIDIGSNDGYLLRFYKERGVNVLGVEPAKNVAAEAQRRHGIPSVTRFFSLETAREIRGCHGAARVIHANNVMAHVRDLHGFTAGLRELLGEDGECVIEVAYAPDMIEAGTFDMIYHEHLCFYTLRTLSKLLSMHGLAAFDVERIPPHGGSIRVYAGRGGRWPETPRLLELRALEEKEGVHGKEYVDQLSRKAKEVRSGLRALLGGIRSNSDAGIAVYGVAAKATVLLNFLDLPKDTFGYAVDKNPGKQNRLLPGPDIPIRSPDVLFENPPGFVLITAWNLVDEIIDEFGDLSKSGTKFIVPFPELRVL